MKYPDSPEIKMPFPASMNRNTIYTNLIVRCGLVSSNKEGWVDEAWEWKNGSMLIG